MNRKLCAPYLACFYRKNKLAFFLASLATLLNTLLGFSITWILQEMLDAAVGVAGAMSIPGLLAGALSVVGSLCAVKILLYFSKPRFLKKAMMQFKAFALDRLLQKNIRSFQKESTADYLSAFTNDMTSIETNYLEAQFLLIRNALEMTGALAMMLWYNPAMTGVSIAFLLLPTAAAALQGSKMETAETSVSSENAGVLSALRDCLSGFSVVKSFSAEKQMSRIMRNRIDRAEQAKCTKRKITTILDSVGSLAALTAQLGTFLTGTILILLGTPMTPGVLVAFMDLTSTFIDPVSELPALFGNRRASLALIRTMAQALNEQVREASGQAHLEDAIRLDHVSYAYEAEKPVLQDVSVCFQAGKSYAIVGASGSGKSTMLNLLMGADHYEGSVCYDGVPLEQLSSASLFQAISIIQQNVFIFNATIRENITMFAPFPESEIDRAIRQSGLSELLEEKGPHYLCGENGCHLSGGEKQRISIARSLLRKSKLLLADEITAALDAETARQVAQAVLDLEDMTRIVVTHSLDKTLLRRYDCILAMKSGQISECGTFDALMDKKGYFYSLYTVYQ